MAKSKSTVPAAELHACPFCTATEGLQIREEAEKRAFYVFCDTCQARGALHVDVANASEAWNSLPLRCVDACTEIREALHKGYALTHGAEMALKEGSLYTARDLLQMAEEILGDQFPLNKLEKELGIDTRPADGEELPAIAA